MYAPNNIIELFSMLSKAWDKKKSVIRVMKKPKLKKQKRTKHSYRNIQRIEDQILEYICIHPISTAYEIYKKRALYIGEYIDDYKLIRRCINDLYEKGLIERLQRKAVEHKAKPCTLTISGIFYLSIERKIMRWDIYKGILENYGNNILFESFLYPYIKRETAAHLIEIKVVSAVCLFLYECCKEIERAVESINTTKHKHVMKQVFIWERVPGDKNETASLTEFLEQRFHLKWLNRAVFKKISNDNTLRIFYKSNSVLITLNDTRTKAVMEIKGENKQKGYEFIVESLPNGSLNIVALDKPIQEYQAKLLQASIEQRVPSLIFDLTINALSELDYSVLWKDEKFMQTLKETKVKFDKQYEKMIMGTQLSAS
jgi:hypothetical protein